MKIVIIGSGNIGSLLGVLLTESGQEVTLVEIQDDIVETVKNDGIHLDLSDGKSFHEDVSITSDIKSVGTPDLVIMAVKSYSTRSAIQQVKQIMGENTWIMSVQNGAGNLETISDVLGDDSQIIGGIFLCSITQIEINQFNWVVGTGGLKIGPVNGVMSPMLDDIADLFSKTRIDVVTTDKVQNLIWSKVLQNVPLAISAALRLRNDEFVAYPHAKKLIIEMAQECVEVSNALGVTLDHQESPIEPLLETIQKFHDSGVKPKSSMLQDLEKGRKTEINAINGSIVREGKRMGVPTPVNAVMVDLVKVQEEKYCS